MIHYFVRRLLIAEHPFGIRTESVGRGMILEIDGLTVTYDTPNGPFVAVDAVDLSVAPGEIVGLVGESGAGKSTVTAAITQLIDPPGKISSGSVRLQGTELVGKSEAEMCAVRAQQIGNIFQEPLTALSPVLTVGAQLKRSIFLSTGISDKTALHERAVDLVESVGIGDAAKRLRQYPHQFSGGMCQRLVIAMALAGEPTLIIADEPTTALDVSIQSEILKLIGQLCRDRNVGVILITHDMAVVNEVASRVAILYQGRVVERGETAQVINNPEHPYTRALIAAVPRTDRKLPRFVILNNHQTGSQLSQSGSHFDAQWTNEILRTEASQSTPLVRFCNIGKRFILEKAVFRRNTRYLYALDDVSFSIAHGEVFGLVGESSSGKSTIARILCGLETADSGQVLYKGIDVTDQRQSKSLRNTCADIQMVFQDPYSSLNPRRTIFATLAEPLQVHRQLETAQVNPLVNEVLAKVGLSADAAAKYPHQFSGGQRQRICIARALLMRPRLLVCDEPTSSLDVAIQAQLLNLLKDLRDELSLTILFVSHDLAVIRQMCDRVAVLKSGRLCEIGDAESLFHRPTDQYTRQLLDRMPSFSTAFSP